MRGEHEIVEDLIYKKSTSIFNKKFTKIALITLIFIILCGLCFNLVYFLSYTNIEKKNEVNNSNKQNSTNKVYIIEQKLRKDLEKKNLNTPK